MTNQPERSVEEIVEGKELLKKEIIEKLLGCELVEKI